MALIVQKYGGTSVANLERIKNVASRVAKTYDGGNEVVVILSAMAGITDGLIQMAGKISELPDKRELGLFHHPLQASLCELRPDTSLEAQSTQRGYNFSPGGGRH